MANKKLSEKSAEKLAEKPSKQTLDQHKTMLEMYRKGKAEAYDEAARLVDSMRSSATPYGDALRLASELRNKSFDLRRPL